MDHSSGSGWSGPAGLIRNSSRFLKILYLFGKSDIPAAALPSVRTSYAPHSVNTKLMTDGSSSCACWTIKFAPGCRRIPLESTPSSYIPGRSML